MRGGELLLAQRSDDRSFNPGVWGVIGGHCEGDEGPADALVREVQEEIGVTPSAFVEIAVLDEPRPAAHGEARYHIFLVTAWTGGEPQLHGPEHSALRWLTLAEALALPLAHPAYSDLFRSILTAPSAF